MISLNIAIPIEEVNKSYANRESNVTSSTRIMLEIGGWHQSSAFNLTNLANSFVNKLLKSRKFYLR